MGQIFRVTLKSNSRADKAGYLVLEGLRVELEEDTQREEVAAGKGMGS